MTDFNTPEGRWRAGSIAAIGVALLAVGFQFLVPAPDAAKTTRKFKDLEFQTKKEVADLERAIDADRVTVASHMWQAEPDQIGAQAMSSVDSLATQLAVKVVAFRPQRTVTVDEVTRYPYSVVAQGSFPRVVQFVRKLQDPGTNIAVTSVQLSAADGESDNVTATVGLVVFSNARDEGNGS